MKPAYQTMKEAEAAFSRLAKLEQQQAAKEAKYKAKIQALADKHAADIDPLANEQAAIRVALADYAAAHRAELTDNGKTKTAAIGKGRLKWRKQPDKLEITGDTETIIAVLKRRRLSRFIRVKEELNKPAILAEIGKLKTPIDGIKTVSGNEVLNIETGA